MQRPSQKLIAQRLGISTAAVSLALRNTGTVSKELTAKVRAMADKLGYRPNPLLSSLASRRFQNSGSAGELPIALFDGRATEDRGALSKIFEKTALEFGYRLCPISPEEFATYKDPGRTLYLRGLLGFILEGRVDHRDFPEDFDWDQFSVVQCGCNALSPRFDSVGVSLVHAVEQAFQGALGNAYRRIGFIIEPSRDNSRSKVVMIESAALAIRRLEAPSLADIPAFTDSVERSPGEFRSWLGRYQPDCIIASTSGAMKTLSKFGIDVPSEVAFVSLDAGEGAHRDGSTVAGVCSHAEEIAKQSLMLLDHKIKHRSRGFAEVPKQILIPPLWQEGSTLPRRLRPADLQIA